MVTLERADVEDVRRDPAVRILLESAEILMGEFHCGPPDPRWNRENCAAEGHFVVFPGTSVFISNAGDDPVVTTPNQVMLYNRNQSYRRAVRDPRGDHCTFFMVTPELLSEVARVDGASSQSRPNGFHFPKTHGPVSAPVYLVQRLVARSLRRSQPADRLRVEEAIYCVIGRAVTDALGPRPGVSPARARTERVHARIVEEVKALLSDRFGENLFLDDISAAVMTSPFHLARIFRTRTGYALHEFRNHLRLRRSLDLIFEPATSLASVAMDLGYASHSHFTDSFRRVFGISPSRVRGLAAAHGSAMLRGELEGVLNQLR